MSGFFDDLILRNLRSSSNPIELNGNFPVATCFKNLNLVDIPRVMREKKYLKGAELMEHWFLGAAFVMPAAWKAAPPNTIDPRVIPPVNVNDKIITMQWALGFARALSVYNELRAAVLGNGGQTSLEFSQRELFKNLKSDGKFSKKEERFGFGGGKDLHKTAHVNVRTVSANNLAKLNDPLDDMYCVLGAFGLHVAASGVVTPSDGKRGGVTHQVKIEKIGFYIKDTYDFNEDQPLGLWDQNGVFKSTGAGRALIENSSFRAWRSRFRRGGDFMLFSNVRWEGVPKPIVWDYSAR